MHRQHQTKPPTPLLLIALAVLTAPAFGEWDTLASTPFAVEDGGGIVFGEGRIWGVFSVEDSDNTYLARYDIAEDVWVADSVEELDARFGSQR